MPEPLKNMYNPIFIGTLADAVQETLPSFDKQGFHATVLDSNWEGRELKSRMRHISHSLRAHLPDDYPQAVALLRQAALSERFKPYRFEPIIFCDFVEVYGLEHWEESIGALAQFTQQSSAEFAVRPFILQDQDRMMRQMLDWSQADNEHLRRLASEGCRPRLPWGMLLKPFMADPSPILPILENLKADSSDYVRRSVANNLNDIAKEHPQRVIHIAETWQQANQPETNWIIQHGLRTLLKKGDAQALALLGYEQSHALHIANLRLTNSEVRIGESLEFAFDIQAEGQAVLMIDYVIEYMKANGQRSPKVFKLAKKSLQAGERLTIQKRHSFRPVTTRRYYLGAHRLAIQVNGIVYASVDFELA